MAPQWEEKISKTLVSTDQGSFAALDPNEVQRLVRDVSKSMEEVSQRGQVPVLLTTPELRRHVRRLLGRFLPSLSILSYNEISPDTRILAINR
jgi:flagellar biosynthesis protein FlhA